ncbi:MAG: hypothetical protein DMG96_09955 [Acidobacteria bacterium]|nr:MAG: hypothetical protein DMG96_09955 [Acidobacteriota bacterium]
MGQVQPLAGDLQLWRVTPHWFRQEQEIQVSRTRSFSLRLAALLLLAQCILAQEHIAVSADAVLWADPGDLRSRDLFWGPGGKDRQPALPVEFLAEDLKGTSPKFEVRDSDGKKWTAKLGLEAKPETAAARLLWAVGYSANENYFVPNLQVKNLPATLSRGQSLMGHDGNVPNVRLQRHPHPYKRVGNWNWRHNPFYGTREFNGLRVMMGLIANWDLKNENNAILDKDKDGGPKLYEVSDVGTAMGTSGKSYTDKVSKGNLSVYRRTRLISHVHDDYIDLNFPKCPPLSELFEFEWGFFFHQLSIRWVGKHIPRRDAKWIGSLLSQLTIKQIGDAFRAAGYSPAEVEAYTQAVLSRIQELNRL